MIPLNPHKYRRQTCWNHFGRAIPSSGGRATLTTPSKVKTLSQKNQLLMPAEDGWTTIHHTISHRSWRAPRVERDPQQHSTRDKDNNSNAMGPCELSGWGNMACTLAAEPLQTPCEPFKSLKPNPQAPVIRLAEKHLQSFSCPARSETAIKGDHTGWFLYAQGTAHRLWQPTKHSPAPHVPAAGRLSLPLETCQDPRELHKHLHTKFHS